MKGFTLIEVVIYIALFTILIGSGFATAIQLIDGSNQISLKTTIQEEGNFVMRKIDWALTGLNRTSGNLPTVTGSGCSQTLTVNKLSHPSNPIVIRRNSGSQSVEINQGGAGFTPITTINTKVTCFEARIIPASGTSPSGITATSTINGIEFSVTRYFRN